MMFIHFGQRWASFAPLLLLFLSLIRPVGKCVLSKATLLMIITNLFAEPVMVKHENFKTCDQSGFCKRNRAFADTVLSKGSSWISPYQFEDRRVKAKNGQVTGMIVKTHEDTRINLPITVTFLQSGSVRVTVDEEKRKKGEIELRHSSQARKERYDEAQKWAVVGGLEVDTEIVASVEKDTTIVKYGPDQKYLAIIRHSPFSIDFKRDGETHVKLNGQGLFNMEHWRPKVEREVKEAGGEDKEQEQEPEPPTSEDESTWWDESFGGSTDSKPRGPESVGLDITFPGYEHVYGIPEHTGPLSLRETRFVMISRSKFNPLTSLPSGAAPETLINRTDCITATFLNTRWTVP